MGSYQPVCDEGAKKNGEIEQREEKEPARRGQGRQPGGAERECEKHERERQRNEEVPSSGEPQCGRRKTNRDERRGVQRGLTEGHYATLVVDAQHAKSGARVV